MTTIRKITSMALGLLTLLPISPGAQAITIDFTTPSQNVTLGNIAQLGIQISDLGYFDALALRSFDLDIVFDPALLAFNGATFGDPALGDQLDISGFGTLTATNLYLHPSSPTSYIVNLSEQSFDLSGTLNSFQAGDFLLATLNFTTLGTGDTTLGILVNQLLDADGADLPLAYAGASDIHIPSTLPPTPLPEPGTIVLFAAGLLAFTWRQRWDTRRA